MLIVFLSACVQEEPGSAVRSADAAACLEPPSGAVPDDDEGADVFTVAGVATADREADGDTFAHGMRCDDVVRVVQVTDDAGQDWLLGYGWDEGGKDETPQGPLQPGSPVAFTFRDLRDGDASGFVLREAGRLAAVIDVGADGPGLREDELPEDLHVAEGEVTGSSPGGDCGRKIARALRFEADTGVTVEAIGSDTVNVEGQLMTVWALASWGWEDPVCDVSGELSWALWSDR